MDKICILWDLDGTIIDSVDLYYEAYRGVFDKYHLGPLNASLEEYRTRYFGAKFEHFIEDHVAVPISDEQMTAMKWDYLRFADQHLTGTETGGISLLPGVNRVIREFHAKGYPMAIASTSWMVTVVHSLEKIGLFDKFVNISSGILLPSKPAPDVFLIAAQMCGMKPERCVVFEDSLAGMRGAKNAGMKCVGISTSVDTTQMVNADIRLDSYNDLSIEDVEALF